MKVGKRIFVQKTSLRFSFWKRKPFFASFDFKRTKSFSFRLFTAEHFVSPLFMTSPPYTAVAILLYCSIVLLFSEPPPFSFLCDSLPPALHFVVLNSYKVPLDTSAAELCNFSHQEDIRNQVEVPMQLLLIYYLSSQVLLQTFITLVRKKTRVWHWRKAFFRGKSTCKNSHTWITSSWKYN